MGVLYSIGKTLVSRDELLEKAAIGGLREFSKNAFLDKKQSINFGEKQVLASDLDKEALQFHPIGMNKPLTIEFLSAYTGDAPSRSFIDRLIGRDKSDLLIVSGSKSPIKFGASPRAINLLVRDTNDKYRIRPSAFEQGSAIIYHSPAITNSTTHVSVEMVVDSFSGDLFNILEKLFAVAAGLQVFAPAAAYLFAGSTLMKMGSKLAESFTETGAFLKANEDIHLDSAGFPIEIARFLVFANDNDLPKLAGYEAKVINENGSHRVTLFDKQAGKEYAGDVPYIIASLDGRDRPEYKDFAPQFATAAMLEQFYSSDPLTGITEVLKESLTLYNDLYFRRSANRLEEQLKGLKKDSPEYKKIEERLKAYKANIQTKELK